MSEKVKFLLCHIPGFITNETAYSFDEIISKSYPPRALNEAFKSVGDSMKTVICEYESKTSGKKAPKLTESNNR